MIHRVQTPKCPRCGKFKLFEVTSEQIDKYNRGVLIQRVFPDMSPEDRERFVSGYCPVCWDIVFGDPADAQH